MRRARLVALALLLAVLGYGVYAYRSFDPRGAPLLDRSGALPEGAGLAPRPATGPARLTAALGDSIHGWLDPLLGLSRSARSPVDEVQVVREEGVLGPSGGLRVRVRRVDGTPGSAVSVTIYAPRGAAAPTMQWTNEQGEAVFAGLASGPGYVVETAGSGSWYADPASAWVGVQVLPGVAREVEVALPGGSFEGQVLDAVTGEPVPNARVEVRPALPPEASRGPRWFQFGAASTDAPRGTTVADAEGKFRLGPFGAGAPYEISARAGDGRRGSIGYRLDGRPPPALRIRIARPSSTSAQVVDEDGSPVAGALVRIATSRVETHSDSAGRFALDPVVPGFLVVERDGATVSRPIQSVLTGGPNDRLRFPTRTAIHARVVDESGGGVPNVGLHLFGLDSGAPGGPERYWVLGRTDATGRARLPALPGSVEEVCVLGAKGEETPFEAEHAAEVSRRGVRRLELVNPVREGDVREVVLTLVRGVVVRGRAVLADGRPAANAAVGLRDCRVPTGDDLHAIAGQDGVFRLVGLEPATAGVDAPDVGLELKFAGVATGKVDISERLPVSRDTEVDVGDVVVRPGALLRGRVVDAYGANVAQARVDTGFGSRAVYTDAQGVYRVAVEQGMRTSLTVQAPGVRARKVTVRGELRAGEVRDVEPIALVPAPTVRVRLVDLAERPVAGAQVRAVPASGGSSRVPPRTDASGWVSLARYGDSPRGLETQDEDGLQVDLGAFFESFGPEGLRITLPDGTALELRLSVPETAADPFDVIVRVPDRYVLEGVVRDEHGVVVPGVPVSATTDHRGPGARVPDGLARAPFASLHATSDAAGHYRIVLAGVPGERWTIQGKHADGRSASDAIEAGRDGVLDLVLHGARETEGEGAGGK